MRRLRIIAVLALALTSVALLSAAQNSMELYQKGLVQERAAGNLRLAIDFYQRAASEAGKNRELAAKALLREAECYRKLGEPKAAELYVEILRTYPEQRESVTAAQAAMAAVSSSSSQTTFGLPNRVAADLASTVTPVLNTYCISCHGLLRSLTPLRLDLAEDHFVANSPDFSQDAAIWEKVLTRLRSRTMPPSGSRQIDDSTNASVISALETALDIGYPPAVQPSDLANDNELAVRIAKFLWSGPPDATLSDLAAHGRLKDSSVLEQQVKRMIADPKSDKFVADFFSRWLRLDNLQIFTSSPTFQPQLDARNRQAILDSMARGKLLYPERTDDFLQMVQHETALFVGDQLRRDRPALELWTANYTFINDRLASLYGIPNVTGNQFRRVTLNGDRRIGVLGQASVLAVTSTATRLSPTLRGKWLWAVFLGIPIPTPPPSLPQLDETPASVDGVSQTLRQRNDAHNANPSCNRCHSLFDPAGDALGNFDVLGRWQDKDAGQPIDASGTLWDGTRFSGPVDFRTALLKYRDSYYSNVTTTMLAYAIGRADKYGPGTFIGPGGALYPYELPAIRAILREAKSSNYSWSSIITGIVKSRPFQTKSMVP